MNTYIVVYRDPGTPASQRVRQVSASTPIDAALYVREHNDHPDGTEYLVALYPRTFYETFRRFVWRRPQSGVIEEVASA